MRSIRVLLATAFLATAPASAMTFSLDGDTVRAAGPIGQGDAERLRSFLGRLQHDEMNYLSVTVALDSPGGNLMEGMRLGMAIREAGVPTLVRQGETCASACAVAFLGGEASGVTSDAVSRNLEPGALLGYHGFFTGGDQVRVVDETLSEARVINAILIEYATRMGSVDVGLLSRLLTTPPERVESIDTPREIAGLGIRLAGEPIKPRKGWARHACRLAVSEMLNPLDPIGVDERVGGEPEPMADLDAFRTRFLDDKFPIDANDPAIREALMGLPASSAIDLLAGQPIDTRAPKVGAWRVGVSRGAGFYYDACYAVTDFTTIWTSVVEGTTGIAVTTTRDALAGYDRDTPLW
ncbi:hypothetical protein [Aureimonas sp. AU4]|uniref:COG3904 family protein n=1 Tax=Aureimonas sp. AU4 TaxID=1638163 RepID=UPI0007806817|nr:hypothetical protein [Aureimonas sp. AU4]